MNFYILAFLLLFTVSSCSHSPDSRLDRKKGMAGTSKIVFRSTDGGQSWQDISKGLPGNLREDSLRGNRFFANDKGLFLRVGSGFYLSAPNATDAFWAKENFPDKDSSLTPAKSGISANNYWGVNLKTTSGMSVWSPIFENFQEPRIRSVFETAGGTIFIGIDRGFFRSTDNGKTWKHVYAGSLVGHLAESNGVLLSTSMSRIIRSTDNGENWEYVTSEGDAAFDVKPIKGGFAAMTSISASNTRGISTSFDGGKTWQANDAGRQDKAVIDSIWRTWNDRPGWQAFMTSIIPIGENFFGAHREGIFRSSDKGKTWQLLLPSVKGSVFNLFVSGNVIYAIPSKGGC